MKSIILKAILHSMKKEGDRLKEYNMERITVTLDEHTIKKIREIKKKYKFNTSQAIRFIINGGNENVKRLD